MCGIAGIRLSPSASVPDLAARLAAMAQAMRHRGPDDQGVFVAADGRAGLANRRLAIRDLSPAGHMPMAGASGAVHITYNGEIYNTGELRAELARAGHRFRSTSDTEVILAGYLAWGVAVVTRLRGMFAFAIHDGRSGRLLLARDRLGVKPLVYAAGATGLVFASEVRALLASGLITAEIDPAGLTGYLLLGSVPSPGTARRAVRALPPATYAVIEADRPDQVTPVTYWQLPAGIGPPLPLTEAVELVQERLLDAVRVRLVSDVPLGAFLSGGLDSSSVVALMRAATDGVIRTCSMVFAEAAYSEEPYARAVAEAVGAEHFARAVTAQDVLAEFDAILASLDQPSVDGVNSYFVSQTARQAGLTVALSGLGGDELFGGYPNTFQEAPRVYRALRLVQAIPGAAGAARATLRRLPDAPRWARLADALARPASPAAAYLTRRGLFAPSEVQALVLPDLWQAAAGQFDPVAHVAQAAGPPEGGPSTMAWTSRAELRTYTQHQLLRDTDAMSMAHSLEVRVPLLDVPLVEAVLRLPDAVKRDAGPGPKPLLAAALGDRLPALVRERRDKQGFTFPFAPWLAGPLRPRSLEVLAAVKDAGWLQPAAVDQVVQDFDRGRIHWSRLWALVALGSLIE